MPEYAGPGGDLHRQELGESRGAPETPLWMFSENHGLRAEPLAGQLGSFATWRTRVPCGIDGEMTESTRAVAEWSLTWTI